MAKKRGKRVDPKGSGKDKPSAEVEAARPRKAAQERTKEALDVNEAADKQRPAPAQPQDAGKDSGKTDTARGTDAQADAIDRTRSVDLDAVARFLERPGERDALLAIFRDVLPRDDLEMAGLRVDGVDPLVEVLWSAAKLGVRYLTSAGPAQLREMIVEVEVGLDEASVDANPTMLGYFEGIRTVVAAFDPKPGAREGRRAQALQALRVMLLLEQAKLRRTGVTNDAATTARINAVKDSLGTLLGILERASPVKSTAASTVTSPAALDGERAAITPTSDKESGSTGGLQEPITLIVVDNAAEGLSIDGHPLRNFGKPGRPVLKASGRKTHKIAKAIVHLTSHTHATLKEIDKRLANSWIFNSGIPHLHLLSDKKAKGDAEEVRVRVGPSRETRQHVLLSLQRPATP